jgi:formate/nitrite transporter FocA (FNT family)
VGDWLGWLGWLATTVAGNAVGGVVIVTLFNYGQVRAPRG